MRLIAGQGPSLLTLGGGRDSRDGLGRAWSSIVSAIRVDSLGVGLLDLRQ